MPNSRRANERGNAKAVSRTNKAARKPTIEKRVPPELEPFIEALAELLVADYMRRTAAKPKKKKSGRAKP
jgi:hypothetical protein